MANKSNPTAPHGNATVESIIGNFTEAQITPIADNTVKQAALECLAMATGIAKVLLEPEDASQEMIAASLKARNITLDDATQLVADGETLLATYNDRVAKEAAARAAGTKSDAATKLVHAQVQSRANIIRGVLGGKSSGLTIFGVKMLGGAGRRPGKASPNKKDAKSTGNGGSGSGTTT